MHITQPMKQPIISVIIPAYNVAPYLERCLASVCGQTFTDMEIIVVNDGSTDKTAAIADAWAAKDARVKVLNTPNCGVADARNIGLENARGKFIGFVDSDDRVEADMFETLYDSINKHRSDISMCGVFNDAADGRLRHYQSREKAERVWSGIEALKAVLIDKHMKSYLWNKLFRKELFEGIVFPSGKVFEDLDVVYKLFAKAGSVSHTGKNSYHYIQRKEGILNAVNPQKEVDYFTVNVDIYNFVLNLNLLSDKERKKIEKRIILRLIKTYRKLSSVTETDEYAAKKKMMLETIKKYYRKNYNPRYYHFYRLCFLK